MNSGIKSRSSDLNSWDTLYITMLHVVKLTNYSKACLCYWMLCC